MKRVSAFIVKHNRLIFILVVGLAIASSFLLFKVSINSDMSKYLPTDSPTKIGMDIAEREFPAASSFNVLVDGLDDSGKREALDFLRGIKHVSGVSYDDTEKYNRDGYALYAVNLDVPTYSAEAKDAVQAVRDHFPSGALDLNGDAAGDAAMDILPLIAGVAFLILLIILLVMCNSWAEPFLFLFSIAVAILLNMGTNIIFGSISNITNSIAAILQLCLSMDYSIMLLNRYRQERAVCADKNTAMKKALRGAFVSISASSITTIAGMLVLVFMSFTIGRDMGFVLAKGVFFSLLCNFTVLPALILMFDRAIAKTAKKSLHIGTSKIAGVSYKFRYVIPVIFLVLFAASFFVRGNVDINYTTADYYKVNQIFDAENVFVVLYDKDDESQVASLVKKWEKNPAVTSVNSYATTLGKPLTPREMAAQTTLDEALVGQIYYAYQTENGETPGGEISVYDFVNYLTKSVAKNPAYAQLLTAETAERLNAAKTEMDDAYKQLEGNQYGRVIITTELPEESAKTFAFVAALNKDAEQLRGSHYVVGNSAMAYEMNNDFDDEMNLITVLSVIAIFVVVMVAFRSFFVPLILVALIQCAVFITMGAAYLQGGAIYYLPLLIVQCLLLGATVDYGILMTSYYREARKTQPTKEALTSAMKNSIHTIMTSGLILITATGTLGFMLRSSDPAISQILITIGVGGLSAVILVVFILPGLLAGMDRFVKGK
jgi:predicted RND superfamily exporter protein